MRPQRIQRRRLLGWRRPEGAIYVGRGSMWGNPFKVGKEVTIAGDFGPFDAKATILARDAAHASDLYRRFITTGIVAPFTGLSFRSTITPEEIRQARAGRDLMCWCPLDQPCHADVLLEIANGGSLE